MKGLLVLQLLEERDAELERTEASLEGHKKAGDARETVRYLYSILASRASTALMGLDIANAKFEVKRHRLSKTHAPHLWQFFVLHD